MIALHISIIGGVPCLWSEGAAIGEIKELRKAAKSIGFEVKTLKSNTEIHALWLPSRGKKPVPSSPLIGDEPDRRRKLVLRPFSAVIRPLTAEEALMLSSLAKNGNIPASGVLFGNSISWLGSILNIVLNLVEEEAFLPSITRSGEYWEARWIPLPDETRERELEKMISNIPAVCRCAADSSDKPPETPKRVSVEALSARMLDSVIRNANSPKSLVKSHNSPHDAWLQALVSENAVINWPNDYEIMAFAKQLSEWTSPVDLNINSPFRFCFRLSEPEENIGDSWRVDYMLRPKSDPSLSLPLADIWKKNSRAAKHLRKLGGVPTEFILAALGQASGLCPDISESLKRKNPSGHQLDANGALFFLRQYAEALRASGFTVLLPSWWVGRGPTKRLGLKLNAKTPKMQGGGLTMETMINFDYSLSLGTEELSLKELEELAKLKIPLVKLRGQWIQIDQKQIRAAIRFLEKQKNNFMSAREILAAALGTGKQMAGMSVDKVEIKGRLKDLLDKLTGKSQFTSLPQPEGFKGKLRDYQERGFSWLDFLRQFGLGACLADDMGLGKTIQALALIQKERKAGEKKPTLLICPTSLVNNWRKEANRFTPELSVLIHHGVKRQKQKRFEKEAQNSAIIISTFGLLHRDIDFIKKIEWAGVILDEAQNIKNPETKQSKAARSLVSEYRIAMTGTPMENHVGDLWALMEFLNPGFLGSQSYFKKTFYKPIQIYHDTEAAERLKEATAPFILRRLKTDKSIIKDLPDKIEIKDYCYLTKEQASLYKAVADDMQKQVSKTEGVNRRGLVLATLMKLKQICNHPAQFADDNSQIADRSGKLRRLMEILTEVRKAGERALIFTQFAEMGKMMRRHLQEQFGEEIFFLHGGVNRKKRDEMVECFQNDENAPRVFILSLRAGGTGLTLTKANHVIHYDRWWNPAVENQATDRVFRIGQKKNVQARKFIVAGTLEERIDDMIENKIGVADQVVGAGEQWLSKLSNEDLKELIKLGYEAIG